MEHSRGAVHIEEGGAHAPVQIAAHHDHSCPHEIVRGVHHGVGEGVLGEHFGVPVRVQAGAASLRRDFHSSQFDREAPGMERRVTALYIFDGDLFKACDIVNHRLGTRRLVRKLQWRRC